MPEQEQNASQRGFSAHVMAEVNRARGLHAPIHSLHEGFAVILEELEEFKEQVFLRENARCLPKVSEELIQLAAMCQRVAEDLRLPPPYGKEGV